MQEQQPGAFRGAWYAARRTLIHFKQQVDEFETYMLELYGSFLDQVAEREGFEIHAG